MHSCDARRAHLILLLTGIAACAPLNSAPAAEPDAADSVKDTAPALSWAGERLIAAVPDGWQNILQVNGEHTRYSDFVPADESATSWTTRLSFEALDTGQISIDPIDMVQSEALEDQRRCSFSEDYNVFSGYENNYETSVRLFLCGSNTNASPAQKMTGEVKLVKIIRGKSHVHAIRLMKRIPAFTQGEQAFTEREMADWSIFLNRVQLCDDTAEHPCPTE